MLANWCSMAQLINARPSMHGVASSSSPSSGNLTSGSSDVRKLKIWIKNTFSIQNSLFWALWCELAMRNFSHYLFLNRDGV